MIRIFLLSWFCFILQPCLAADIKAITTLDELLETVKHDASLTSQFNSEREKRFLEAKKEQKSLLNSAKKDLRKEEKQSDKLNAFFDENENTIRQLEAKLDVKSVALGELFGVVRQVADDVSGILENSVVSAEFPKRQEFTLELAQSKALPNIGELEKLWFTLLEEMTEAGKVTRFEAPLITADGQEQQGTVTRVGVFNAFSDGKYLRYLNESGRLVQLARQPATRFQELAMQLETAQGDGMGEIGLDPSRGAILSVLVQTPSFWERIRQGGIIAYVIIGVGCIALLLVLERFVYLSFTGHAVKRQLKSEEISIKNPLGRVLQQFKENPQQDTETLQLKLEESVLKELPKIERGLASIGVLAAIAPLLGLLGTVTGMITTFQSITLFGTGDPKYMSSGISQALVTTELGLMVAVPIVLSLSFLTSKGTRLVQVLDEQSAGVVARLVEKRNENGNSEQDV